LLIGFTQRRSQAPARTVHPRRNGAERDVEGDGRFLVSQVAERNQAQRVALVGRQRCERACERGARPLRVKPAATASSSSPTASS
jgi:hypothetical protein